MPPERSRALHSIVHVIAARTSSKVTYDSVGPVVFGAAEGTSVSSNYGDYVDRKRLSNSSHGLCAILLAATAMETNCP